MLRCVGKAQREHRHGYLVLEEMILENDWLCCMKQSVPQASALNEYSIDVRISVFSAASKITFFELFSGFALILVNSRERKNDLKPLISSLKAIKSLHLYILYFSTSVRLNMHMQTRLCDSNSMRLSIIHWKMAHLRIFLPCEMYFLSRAINSGNLLNFVEKTARTNFLITT